MKNTHGSLKVSTTILIPLSRWEQKRRRTKKALPRLLEGVIFKNFSLGVSTNRDVWVYNYNQDSLRDNVQRMMETYTAEVDRWKHQVTEWKRGNAPETQELMILSYLMIRK